MTTQVRICEVGPRDGLQNDNVVLPAEVRAELSNRLAMTGVARVEAVSFVAPARVPPMADAEGVVARLDTGSGGSWSGLVLNERGLQRALATGLDTVNFAFPATETFCHRNQNSSVAGAAKLAATIVDKAHVHGVRSVITIAAAFGCPFEGSVPEGRVIDLAEQVAAAGADEVFLADTIGVGVPAQVHRLLSGVRTVVGSTPVGLHLHNTRNTGYANAYAALEHEIDILDASVGGLGGCPFAPKATGNIATEDLIYLLDKEKVSTGVDIDAMIGVTEWLGGILGRSLPGMLHQAGTFPAAAPAMNATVSD
jgi:hydroxymethylglutaryl-CoA lyase/(R)-citramalyl-CoA lyase